MISSLPALAKRIVYLPPLTSTFSVGGYDTTIIPKKYCEVDFSFKETLFDSALTSDKKTSGGNIHFRVSLVNTGKSIQKIDMIVEDATFKSCYWQAGGQGAADGCINSYNSNGGLGYKTTFTLAPGTSEIKILQVGCQGNNANNNCYMFEYPPTGQPIAAGITHFGINAIFNPGPSAAKLFYCYKVTSSVGVRFEVTQDRGSVMGTVALGETGALGGGVETRTTGASNFNINGGRPF